MGHIKEKSEIDFTPDSQRMRNKRYPLRLKKSFRDFCTMIEREKTDSHWPWFHSFCTDELDPSPDLLELIVTLVEGVEGIHARKARALESIAIQKANEEEARRRFLASKQEPQA